MIQISTLSRNLHFSISIQIFKITIFFLTCMLLNIYLDCIHLTFYYLFTQYQEVFLHIFAVGPHPFYCE